jgi:hypothetical protein
MTSQQCLGNCWRGGREISRSAHRVCLFSSHAHCWERVAFFRDPSFYRLWRHPSSSAICHVVKMSEPMRSLLNDAATSTSSELALESMRIYPLPLVIGIETYEYVALVSHWLPSHQLPRSGHKDKRAFYPPPCRMFTRGEVVREPPNHLAAAALGGGEKGGPPRTGQTPPGPAGVLPPPGPPEPVRDRLRRCRGAVR